MRNSNSDWTRLGNALRAIPVLILGGILGGILSACERMPGPANRRPFTMNLSSGGGFSGMYSGCTLASDGTVIHWQKFGGRDSTLAKAMGSPETILSLRRKLEADGALSIHNDATGNMTTRAELKTADSVYSWSWSGSGLNENTPSALKAWFADADAYCQSFSAPAASERK